MTPEVVMDLFSEALYLTVLLVLVIVGPSLIVGLIVSMFQAATQINEQTLSFLPRLIMTIATIGMAGPWILTKFMDLSGERNSKLREAIESENEQDDDPITVEPVAQETPSETTTEPIQYAVKDTDLVSPLSQWAIKTAADAWNIDISAANRQLASANLPATMSRGQFKDFVTEGVKP